MGAARRAGPGGGFRPVLVGKNGNRHRTIHPLAGGTARDFSDWRERYGRVNEHNGWVPRDFWLQPWEKHSIIRYYLDHPLEGYRRLTFMMLDADVVAVSPSSVWRVLQQGGLLSRWKGKPSRKGTGFEQPPHPHQHWHIDVSYINVSGTFYYLRSILDGFSRSIVHWDLRESMTEAEMEVLLQRAREKYPEAKPRIISDNGPGGIARSDPKVRARPGPRESGTLSCATNLLGCRRLCRDTTAVSPRGGGAFAAPAHEFARRLRAH